MISLALCFILVTQRRIVIDPIYKILTGKPPEQKLTERKHRLEAAVNMLRAQGETPTIKALAEYLGVHANTIRKSVDEHEGLIREREMNNFLKRIERTREALELHLETLEQRKMEKPTLVYADGSRRSVGVLEAVDEICRRGDVVDMLSTDETTRSLLLAVLGPWDFSGLEELAGQ